MLTFHINLYCPKTYYRLNHSRHIVEYTKKIIIPEPNIFNWTRTQDTNQVCNLYSCNLPTETNILYGVSFCIALSYQATESIFTGTRTQDRFFLGLWPLSCNLVETNNFGLGAVLLPLKYLHIGHIIFNTVRHIFTHDCPINFIQQSPCWEANSCLASPLLLWIPKGSSQCWRQSATDLYHKPDECSLQILNIFI
jgi:hypothetical protein